MLRTPTPVRSGFGSIMHLWGMLGLEALGRQTRKAVPRGGFGTGRLKVRREAFRGWRSLEASNATTEIKPQHEAWAPKVWNLIGTESESYPEVTAFLISRYGLIGLSPYGEKSGSNRAR
jgi:hypothetical protein